MRIDGLGGAVEQVAVNVSDSSPRRILAAWANDQDSWVRELVRLVLGTHQPPSSDEVEHLFELFMAEKGLTDGAELPSSPKLEVVDAEEAEDDTLELVRLDQVEGVNALAEGQTLEFDPGLTILFGRNGSGKTGYARVLKRIAAARTAEEILGNASAPDEAIAPTARLAYKLGAETSEVIWKNELGLAPFTRISVFDASAVHVHVDQEIGYVYTPAELALFEHTARGVQAVQARVEAEVVQLRPSGNHLLQNYERGSQVYPLIETLSEGTDLPALELLAELDDDAEERHAKLEEEVAALRGGALDALMEVARQRHEALQSLRQPLEHLAAFDPAAYNAAHAVYRSVEQERDRASRDLFDEAELAGPMDADWRRFIAAADAYRAHLGFEDYPHAGDACLYCRQPLSEDATSLVRRFRQYLDDSLARQVAAAREELLKLRPGVDAAALQRALALLASDRLEEGSRPHEQAASSSLLAGGAAVAEVGALVPVADRQVGVSARAALELLDAEIARVSKDLTGLRQRGEDRAGALALRQAEIADLRARLRLRRDLSAIRKHVTNAQRASRLTLLGRRISTAVSRPLTEQSKVASEDLVNKNFERFFDEESQALRAPKVALQFQGRQGKAERRKAVAAYRPSAVLSEGEQKVLALADFLAESRLRGTTAPIVFDDPVTSLDYVRIEEVAARIARLATSHQVVVLTHNLMFASELLSLRQAKKLRVAFYEVRQSGGQTGILAVDVEPRLDSVKDIGKRIEALIRAAESADAAVQDALIEKAYDLMRSWCEAFVEQELLASVTQRYRANVMMTKLGAIKADRLTAAAAVVGPLFEKACRYMGGHSQPAEQLNVRPTLDELNEDWAAASRARSEYLSA